MKEYIIRIMGRWASILAAMFFMSAGAASGAQNPDLLDHDIAGRVPSIECF